MFVWSEDSNFQPQIVVIIIKAQLSLKQNIPLKKVKIQQGGTGKIEYWGPGGQDNTNSTYQ